MNKLVAWVTVNPKPAAIALIVTSIGWVISGLIVLHYWTK